MTHTGSLVFAGIAPHPPIMVPEVGRDAIGEVRKSIDAMGELTQRLIASGAETVVLISPHAPLEPLAFVAYDGPRLYGDLCHRLKRDAPAGYNPDAHLFDEEVVDAIRLNSTTRIIEIDQSLRRLAGECGYRSMLVGLGVAEGLAGSCEVISYEAPFGVGYLVAQLFADKPDVLTTESSRVGSQSLPRTSTRELRELPALARRAVETFVTAREVIDSPADLPDVFNARGACFVCIKTVAGDLRGCIGT